MAEQKEQTEARLAELEAQLATLSEERDQLKAQVEEAQRAQARAKAQGEIDALFANAELPELAKARLRDRFREAENVEGVAEAIADETQYLASLSDAGAIKGFGESKAPDDDPRKALSERAKALANEKGITFGEAVRRVAREKKTTA